MGFKLGAIIGLGAGYYYGAKAGRERYEQLNRWAQKAKETDAYEAATSKVKGMASEGVAVARARISSRADDADPTADLGSPSDFSSN